MLTSMRRRKSSSARREELCSWESWEAAELGLSKDSVSLIDFIEENGGGQSEQESELHVPPGIHVAGVPTIRSFGANSAGVPKSRDNPSSAWKFAGMLRSSSSAETGCGELKLVPSNLCTAMPKPWGASQPDHSALLYQHHPSVEGSQLKPPSPVGTHHGGWMTRLSDWDSSTYLRDEINGDQSLMGESREEHCLEEGKGSVCTGLDDLHGSIDLCWPQRLYSEFPKGLFKNSSLSDETRLIQEWIESYEQQSTAHTPFACYALRDLGQAAFHPFDSYGALQPAKMDRSFAEKTSLWPGHSGTMDLSASTSKPALQTMRSMPEESLKGSFAASCLDTQEGAAEDQLESPSPVQFVKVPVGGLMFGLNLDSVDKAMSGPLPEDHYEANHKRDTSLGMPFSSVPLPPPATACEEQSKVTYRDLGDALSSKEVQKPLIQGRRSNRSRKGISRTQSLPSCAEEEQITLSNTPDATAEDCAPFVHLLADDVKDPHLKSQRRRPSLQIFTDSSQPGGEADVEIEPGLSVERDLRGSMKTKVKVTPTSPASEVEGFGLKGNGRRGAGKGACWTEGKVLAQSAKASPTRRQPASWLWTEKILLPPALSMDCPAVPAPQAPNSSHVYIPASRSEGSKYFTCYTRPSKAGNQNNPKSSVSLRNPVRKLLNCSSNKAVVSRQSPRIPEGCDEGGAEGSMRAGSLLPSPKETFRNVWLSMKRSGDPPGGSALQRGASTGSRQTEVVPDSGQWEFSNSDGLEDFSDVFVPVQNQKES